MAGKRSEIIENAKRLAVLLVIAALVLVVHAALNRPHIRGGAVGPLQTSCKKVPSFATSAGITKPVFDTSQRGRTGLVVYDTDHPERVFQHPSWKAAGNLGPIAVDDTGNIYAAPVPNINTLANPADKQNTIYFVNTDTGVMSEYYSLKHVAMPNQTNPYGILSLAFDCETKVLYASTISGSTTSKTNGTIVAIDTKNKKEISRLSGVDALSIGLFRDSKGAELYYGLANHSQVWRVGLTSGGAIIGKPDLAFTYDPFDELKPRKLDFTDSQTLQVHTTEFRYNLVASTEFRQDIVAYTYDARANQWRAVPADKP
jgi:hypothetical protein